MSAQRPAFLGIDLGTTNVKAVVVEEDGRTSSSGSAPVSISHSAEGAAEQDIEEIWQAACRALTEAAGGTEAGRIRSVGVSSQGGAIQILSSKGEPTGRIVGWQDSRGERWDRDLTARYGREWFSARTGYAQSCSAIGQLLRLRDQSALPEGFILGFVGDVVVGRLCGRRAHDATSLSEACLLNPYTGTTDPHVLDLIGLSRARMPDQLPADQAAGRLLPEVARPLGLPAGIPVGPAVHDQYAAAIGCGAVASGDTMFGAGTAWVLLAVSDNLQPPIAGIALAGRHPVPGLFGQMLSMVNGGACVSWAVRTLNLGRAGVRQIDELMHESPPGSRGLRFRPLLSEIGGHGLPHGTPGRLDGLRLEHTSAHVMRSLIEGLACELGRYLVFLTRGGVPVQRLVMCGGAASSRVTPEIIADTVGLPVDCALQSETSSLGAAVLARRMVDPAEPLATLASRMKPETRSFAPGTGRDEAAARLAEYLSWAARAGSSGV